MLWSVHSQDLAEGNEGCELPVLSSIQHKVSPLQAEGEAVLQDHTRLVGILGAVQAFVASPPAQPEAEQYLRTHKGTELLFILGSKDNQTPAAGQECLVGCLWAWNSLQLPGCWPRDGTIYFCRIFLDFSLQVFSITDCTPVWTVSIKPKDLFGVWDCWNLLLELWVFWGESWPLEVQLPAQRGGWGCLGWDPGCCEQEPPWLPELTRGTRRRRRGLPGALGPRAGRGPEPELGIALALLSWIYLAQPHSSGLLFNSTAVPVAPFKSWASHGGIEQSVGRTKSLPRREQHRNCFFWWFNHNIDNFIKNYKTDIKKIL